jgi:hypothetical protein
MKRFFGLLLLTSLACMGTGCRNTCSQHPWCRPSAPAQPAFVAPPAPTILQPVPQGFAPPQGFPVVPQQPPPQQGGFPVVPQQPPPQQAFPGVPQQQSQAPSIAPPGPGGTQSRFEPNWKPTEAREPIRDVPPRIQLYAPEQVEQKPNVTSEPPIDKKPNVQSTFPAIPQFSAPLDKVFAGLRPPVDGFDWLQRNRVNTVVNIHLPGEDDSADRKQVESRGMRYVSFEVSPMTLTKEKAEEFIKLIRDNQKQGAFVYDRDGSLAGAMWYLQLRWGEILDDDAAQLRAAPLGLQPNREGAHRDMWLAVQKVLSENP